MISECTAHPIADQFSNDHRSRHIRPRQWFKTDTDRKTLCAARLDLFGHHFAARRLEPASRSDAQASSAPSSVLRITKLAPTRPRGRRDRSRSGSRDAPARSRRAARRPRSRAPSSRSCARAAAGRPRSAGQRLEHQRGDMGHAGEDEDVAVADAGRARHPVLDQLGALGHAGHAQPRLGDPAATGIISLEHGARPGMDDHRHAERGGDRIDGDVVMGRPDAAGGEEIIVAARSAFTASAIRRPCRRPRRAPRRA